MTLFIAETERVMPIRPFPVCSLLVISFALAGCNTLPPASVVTCEAVKPSNFSGPALVGKEYGQAAPNPIPLNAVLFSKPALAQLVTVQSISASRTDNGNVKIEARLVGCSARPLPLVARAHFLRANQSLAEPVSAWKSVPLQGGGISYYAETSFSRDVGHYLIEIDAESL